MKIGETEQRLPLFVDEYDIGDEEYEQEKKYCCLPLSPFYKSTCLYKYGRSLCKYMCRNRKDICIFFIFIIQFLLLSAILLFAIIWAPKVNYLLNEGVEILNEYQKLYSKISGFLN